MTRRDWTPTLGVAHGRSPRHEPVHEDNWSPNVVVVAATADAAGGDVIRRNARGYGGAPHEQESQHRKPMEERDAGHGCGVYVCLSLAGKCLVGRGWKLCNGHLRTAWWHVCASPALSVVQYATGLGLVRLIGVGHSSES